MSLVIVSDSRDALARLSDYFYDHPSRDLRLIGVTGTNGKTTVTYILSSIISQAGKKWGRIGTVGYDMPDSQYPSSNTTPESLDLQRMIRSIAKQGGEYCLLEVSSHALDQRRTAHLAFQKAIFTNLTQDHLDYHGDMETYFKAKSMLFTRHQPKVAVINVDDPWGQKLLPMAKGKVITYGVKNKADVYAKDIKISMNQTSMILCAPAGGVSVKTGLAGMHNVYNILAASAAAVGEGMSLETISKGVEKCVGAPGRFEKVEQGQPFSVVVDYAHTEDALVNILNAAKELKPARVITVFGCGGDRDKIKRPLMGRAAWERSDLLFITSDNPRTEDPEAIIADILKGIPEAGQKEKVTVIADRAKAIGAAIRAARENDMVVLAGKGHEDYQILETGKVHFDDKEQAATALKEIYGKVHDKPGD